VAGGARLVVIDPRRKPMASRAHLHLAVRPGTDVVLALALANHWANTGALATEFLAAHADGVDELLAAASVWSLEAAAAVCGIDAESIATLASWWTDTTPTLLRIGWGQERNANGGAACRAILALPVLAGSFGEPGSGVLGSTRTDAVDTRRRWPAFAEPPRSSVNLHEVGQWLAPHSDHPCQVLVVQGANPVVMCPDQRAVLAAFARTDVFTVVHEQVLTDTARYADVVFPATTAFEIDDVITPYGSLTVQPVRAVIERVGESRPNDEFGLALAQHLGFAWSVPTGAAAVHAVVAHPGPRMVAEPSLQFVDTFPRGGRAQLVDGVLGAPTYAAVESRHPLTLISPATSKLINSMFGEFQSPHPTITVHPSEAIARNLTPGSDVAVFNDAGSLTVRLEVSEAVRPGVAVMAKGVWLRHHAEGFGVNLLTPASSDTLANGACFNDTHVDIGRVTARLATDQVSV
jgi:anaerobic selenocysteine-containing dehydrogenase